MDFFNFLIIQNDCEDLKFISSSKEEVSLKQLTAKNLEFILEMNANANSNNQNWYKEQIPEKDFLLNIRNIFDLDSDLPKREKRIFFICPSWKPTSKKLFKFEILSGNDLPIKTIQARLLENVKPKPEGRKYEELKMLICR